PAWCDPMPRAGRASEGWWLISLGFCVGPCDWAGRCSSEMLEVLARPVDGVLGVEGPQGRGRAVHEGVPGRRRPPQGAVALACEGEPAVRLELVAALRQRGEVRDRRRAAVGEGDHVIELAAPRRGLARRSHALEVA